MLKIINFIELFSPNFDDILTYDLRIFYHKLSKNEKDVMRELDFSIIEFLTEEIF